MRDPIDSPEGVLDRIEPGEWVLDAEGNPWCLMNTHVMVAQVMWKAGRAHHYVALDQVSFPIYEAEFNGECEHKRTQECGHCERCGAVVGDPETWKHIEYGFGLPPGLSDAQQVAFLDQVGAAIREHFPDAVVGGQSDAPAEGDKR